MIALVVCSTSLRAQTLVPLRFTGPTNGVWDTNSNWTVLSTGTISAFAPNQGPGGGATTLNTTLISDPLSIGIGLSSSSSGLDVAANLTLTAAVPQAELVIKRELNSSRTALQLPNSPTLTLGTGVSLVIEDQDSGNVANFANESFMVMNSGSKFLHKDLNPNLTNTFSVDWGSITVNNADFEVQDGMYVGFLSNLIVDGGANSRVAIGGTLEVWGSADLGARNNRVLIDNLLVRNNGKFSTGNIAQDISLGDFVVESGTTLNLDILSATDHDVMFIESDFLIASDTTLQIDYLGSTPPVPGTVFHLFRTDSPVTDLFSNLQVNYPGQWQQLLINDPANSRYGLAVTFIPEPGSFVALGIAAMLAARRPRR
jgi:hypothetical protein